MTLLQRRRSLEARVPWPFLAALALAAGPARAQDGSPPPADRLDRLEQRVAALEGAPAKSFLSEFNPAMGMALDMAYRHQDGLGGFDFRAAELNVEAPVDPFLKGWAVVTGTNGSPAVDVEEAALETTALPGNLTVRGGRLFASFGRLAHFHDHELPVVDRPLSLDSYIGGETRADGAEVQYLFPTPFYLTATAGAYDKMGAGNARVDPSTLHGVDELTYLGRLATYADIGESQSLELGLDSAWTPHRSVGGASVGTQDTWRTLSGLDLTYRWQPVRGGLYRGLLWGTEILQNDERRFNPTTSLPSGRVTSWAGYSFVELKAGRHWRPGVLVDMTQDLDNNRLTTRSAAVYLTYDVTEFQRLRLEYKRTESNVPGDRGSDLAALQWTGVFGRHVHGFRDR